MINLNLFLSLPLGITMLCPGVAAQSVLKATIEETAVAETRIHKLESSTLDLPAPESPTRIHRASASSSSAGKSLLPEFAKVDADVFTSQTAKPFDLEAEAHSRELMIAWDLWHRQLGQAIYYRVRALGESACIYAVTVTVQRQISVKILSSTGNPVLKSSIIAAANSLNGDLGLAFPTGSQRKVVTDEFLMAVGRNIKPGVNFDRHDTEIVH